MCPIFPNPDTGGIEKHHKQKISSSRNVNNDSVSHISGYNG